MAPPAYYKTWFLLATGIWVLLLACACIVLAAGWMLWPRPPQHDPPARPVDAAAPAAIGNVVAPGNVAAKAPEQWNFQDLQDHFAGKGMALDRLTSRDRPGMWFGPKGRMPASEQELIEHQGPYKGLPGQFHVEDWRTPDEAAAVAARFVDVQQRPAFAWGRFVFRAPQPTLDKLKPLLP